MTRSFARQRRTWRPSLSGARDLGKEATKSSSCSEAGASDTHSAESRDPARRTGPTHKVSGARGPHARHMGHRAPQGVRSTAPPQGVWSTGSPARHMGHRAPTQGARSTGPPTRHTGEQLAACQSTRESCRQGGRGAGDRGRPARRLGRSCPHPSRLPAPQGDTRRARGADRAPRRHRLSQQRPVAVAVGVAGGDDAPRSLGASKLALN